MVRNPLPPRPDLLEYVEADDEGLSILLRAASEKTGMALLYVAGMDPKERVEVVPIFRNNLPCYQLRGNIPCHIYPLDEVERTVEKLQTKVWKHTLH